MSVIAEGSVTELFREAVESAFERQCVHVSERTEHYLISLLGDFSTRPLPDAPLAIKIVDTHEPGERVKALKEVGDTSLYITGFFADSLQGKLVDAAYYIGLGEAAYAELSQRLPGTIASVYDELANKFPRFVDALGEVSERFALAQADVVTLYEHWLKKKSDWVEERLVELGVVISSPSSGYLQ